MSRYSLSAILEKEPVAIATAIRTLIWIGVLAGFLTDPPWDERLLAGLALVVELALGLFVRSAVTPIKAPTLQPGTEVTPTDGGATTTVK